MAVQERSSETEGSRLDSWKEIAEYLGRNVRSAQRWEQKFGMPVHRVSGEKGGVVFAFTGELERWLRSRSGDVAGNPAQGAAESNGEPWPGVPPLATPEAEEIAALAGASPVRTAASKFRSRVTKYAIAIAATAVAAVSVWYFVGRTGLAQRKTVPSSRVVLAVLPFINLSGDPAQEYFTDGLTEEMITDLGCLNPRALGVIARTSAMKYKNTNKDIGQIGRELGVNYVLEGSVRRQRDQVRVSAQLIQVSDQTHVWAQNYELQAKDILSVQREVAATIAEKIKINLESGARTRLALAQLANPEAYDDYLHGRYLLSQRSKVGFREAVKFFNQAIAKDPSFALAYAGLADSDFLLSLAAGDPAAGAKAAALRALDLDENLAEAHTSLAAVYVLEWNWAGAEKEFRRALELNPNYALAHHWYGNLYLSPMGRHQEAIAELKQALELDPLSLIIQTDLGYAYFFAGQYDEAYSEYQKVLAVDASFVSVHWVLMPYYEQRKMYDMWAQELAEFSELNGEPDLARRIKAEYAAGGREKLLEFIVASERKGLYFEPLFAAGADLSLGHKQEALQALEQGYTKHYFNILRLKVDPVWNDLHSEPRFQELGHRIGFR